MVCSTEEAKTTAAVEAAVANFSCFVRVARGAHFGLHNEYKMSFKAAAV